jgi:hypothetical protein
MQRIRRRGVPLLRGAISRNESPPPAARLARKCSVPFDCYCLSTLVGLAGESSAVRPGTPCSSAATTGWTTGMAPSPIGRRRWATATGDGAAATSAAVCGPVVCPHTRSSQASARWPARSRRGGGSSSPGSSPRDVGGMSAHPGRRRSSCPAINSLASSSSSASVGRRATGNQLVCHLAINHLGSTLPRGSLPPNRGGRRFDPTGAEQAFRHVVAKATRGVMSPASPARSASM